MKILKRTQILNKIGGGVVIESMEIYDVDGLAKKITVNTNITMSLKDNPNFLFLNFKILV